ncbi:MAG: sirohydrochlorin cobaltochelatase [Desulfococcaceae bacterium]
MKRHIQWTIWLLAAALAFTAPALSAHAHGGHTRAADKGTGILLVTFGTSIPEAQKAFEVIEERVKAAFPEADVRWAYTSHVIRKKLAKEGQELDSVATALAEMMEEGYSRVAVQSLHFLPGSEFHDVQINSHKFAEMEDGFEKVSVGYPLLSSSADLARVAELALKMAPKDREPEDAVVFMGHGTHHPSDVTYDAMMYHLQKMDPNAFMGTVEGHPTLDDVRAELRERGTKKAYLIPFMSVAGDHVRNDMAGPEAESWKSVLEADGLETVSVLKGMAEVPEIADVWVDHLRGAMKRLEGHGHH